MSTRRDVRVTQDFFDRLDSKLKAYKDAGHIPVPSPTNFLLHELPRIINQLAEDYEGSTEPLSDDPFIRLWVDQGRYIALIGVYTTLADDGAVEVLSIDMEL